MSSGIVRRAKGKKTAYDFSKQGTSFDNIVYCLCCVYYIPHKWSGSRDLTCFIIYTLPAVCQSSLLFTQRIQYVTSMRQVCDTVC